MPVHLNKKARAVLKRLQGERDGTLPESDENRYWREQAEAVARSARESERLTAKDLHFRIGSTDRDL